MFTKGYLFVEFFFILSGFLLYESFTGENHHSAITFARKRFKRLYPEYFFAFSMHIALHIIKRDISFEKLFGELIMMQEIGLFSGGYNYPCWYISVLFWSSIMIYGILSTNRKAFINIISPAAIILGYTFFAKSATGFEAWSVIGPISLPFLRGIIDMTFGVICAVVVQNVKRSRVIINRWFGLILEFIFASIVFYGIISFSIPEIVICLSMGALIIMLFCGFGLSGFLVNCKIHHVSQFTYSAYLNHAMILSGLSVLSRLLILSPTVLLILYLFLLIAVSFFMNRTTQITLRLLKKGRGN